MTRLETIQKHFRTLRMPTAVQVVEEMMATAQKENWSVENFPSVTIMMRQLLPKI
jgi:hypothetical protein